MRQLWPVGWLWSPIRIAERFGYSFDLLFALFVVDVFGPPFWDQIVFELPIAISGCPSWNFSGI